MNICKKLLLILFISPISLSLYCQNNTTLCDFDHNYDTQPILELFEQNWNRLIEGNDKSLPPFMLKHMTHDTNPDNFGSLHIKVLRENSNLAGFVAYYIEKPQEGQILLLAVGDNFRGKGYGKILMKYAMQDLLSKGVDCISLWTDPDNIPAHHIYKDLGFKGKLNPHNGHTQFIYLPE